jgi:hypothetical protein
MSVVIEFLADITQATKEVGDLGKSVDKELKAITSSFKAITGVLAGLGAAIGVGFSLKAAIDEAAQFEDAVNNLATSLRLTGVESDGAVQGLVDFASEIQATTRLSDDAVLSSAALLQSLARLSEDGLKRGTQAAIDLSAALRIDLDSATRLVGKAAEGNTDAFRRYGIEIQKGKNDAETFANTLRTLEDRFGGSAVAQTNSFAGALDQLRNNFNDLLKEIGLGIIQNKDFVATIKALSQAFIDLGPAAVQAGKDVGGFVSATVSTTKSLVRFIIDIGEGIQDLINRLREFEVLNRVFTGFEAGVSASFQAVKILVGGLVDVLGLLRKVNNEQASVDDLRSEQRSSRPVSSSSSGSGSLFSGAPRIDIKAIEDAQKARSKALLKEQDERDKIIKDQLKQEADLRKNIFSNVQTLIGNIGQGAAGVATSLASVSSTFVDMIIPGLGGAASQLVQFLSQGPEAVRAQLQAFIDNIPIVIDRIIESIPAVIEVLAANMPRVALSLSNQMPTIATKLATALIAETPNIAKAFIQSLISESGRLIQSIADGVKDAISKVVGFGGGGGGGILGGLGGGLVGGLVGGPIGAVGGAIKKLKFAEGGIVPGGAPYVDRVPALLTPGEVVLNRSQVEELRRERSSGGASSPGSTQPLTINLMIGEEQLSKVLVNLQRQGFRLNP